MRALAVLANSPDLDPPPDPDPDDPPTVIDPFPDRPEPTYDPAPPFDPEHREQPDSRYTASVLRQQR